MLPLLNPKIFSPVSTIIFLKLSFGIWAFVELSAFPESPVFSLNFPKWQTCYLIPPRTFVYFDFLLAGRYLWPLFSSFLAVSLAWSWLLLLWDDDPTPLWTETSKLCPVLWRNWRLKQRSVITFPVVFITCQSLNLYSASPSTNLLDALPAQPRLNRKDLSDLQKAGKLFQGSRCNVSGTPFQMEKPTIEEARRCLRAEGAKGTKSDTQLAQGVVSVSATVYYTIVSVCLFVCVYVCVSVRVCLCAEQLLTHYRLAW